VDGRAGGPTATSSTATEPGSPSWRGRPLHRQGPRRQHQVLLLREVEEDGHSRARRGRRAAPTTKPSTITPIFRRACRRERPIELTDAIFVLYYQFLGGDKPPCMNAADADDNGAIELTTRSSSCTTNSWRRQAARAGTDGTAAPSRTNGHVFPDPCVYACKYGGQTSAFRGQSPSSGGASPSSRGRRRDGGAGRRPPPVPPRPSSGLTRAACEVPQGGAGVRQRSPAPSPSAPSGPRCRRRWTSSHQHSYWQHPHFPAQALGLPRLVIQNRAMSADKDGDASGPRLTRVLGKPCTGDRVQPPGAPRLPGGDGPMIASFAALQDWDGVFLFAWNHSATSTATGCRASSTSMQTRPRPRSWGRGRLIFEGGLVPHPGPKDTYFITGERLEDARPPDETWPATPRRGVGIDGLIAGRWGIAFLG